MANKNKLCAGDNLVTWHAEVNYLIHVIGILHVWLSIRCAEEAAVGVGFDLINAMRIVCRYASAWDECFA